MAKSSGAIKRHTTSTRRAAGKDSLGGVCSPPTGLQAGHMGNRGALSTGGHYRYKMGLRTAGKSVGWRHFLLC